MPHIIQEDDPNIIQKCRDYGFCCTYDPEGDFRQESVKEAIAAVLASREEQSGELGKMIARTNGIMEPLQKLIASTGDLAEASNKGMGMEASHHDLIESYYGQLVKEKDCLEANLRTLEESKRVMDRKNIRVPVVGLINSGKSTFLHSALGSTDDKKKKNLFPSAGAIKSCTGTRTVLIYDDHTEGIVVVARFKDRLTFQNDCQQSIHLLVKKLAELGIADQFPKIAGLRKEFENGADAIELLKEYYLSAEFKNLCKVRNSDERAMESVCDFCSFVYFSKNQDYSEDTMEEGRPKSAFHIDDLIKSWEENTSYSMQIPSENNFASVKTFVCKYDTDVEKNKYRYTTYCGVQVVEIRGRLYGEIAGLELVDSVGANDDAISNVDQMKTLMQDSDAMIFLERPQSQTPGKWTMGERIQFVREQGKMPDQFLYLLYNCYENNLRTPSDLSYWLDNAHIYYSGKCKRVYVSDISQWEEVQSRMLVDMLVNLAGSVKETHKEHLKLAKNADLNISDSILAIRKIAENLKHICEAEEGNASEKKKYIETILQQVFGGVEELVFKTWNENATTLKGKVNDTTNRLDEKVDLSPIPFEKVYEYVISDTPGYIYNRYTAYLFMYARILENVKRQYQNLKNDIDAYVEKKRRELLGILWGKGRFQCIMSDISHGDGSAAPDADKICAWLRRHTRELLADALEELLLGDIKAESLIDGSIGKVIEQFDPKNLTAEQLFGQRLSDPNLENNESEKAEAIAQQLSGKVRELKTALLESVSRNAGMSPDTAKTGQGNDGKKRGDDGWEDIFNSDDYQNDVKPPKAMPEQSVPVFDDGLFDLDKKVRKGVVCDNILKKFRDKLRGDGLSQNTDRPISQLYNLYDQYYDVLLSENEVLHKKRLSELRRGIIGLSKQLMAL